MQDNKTISRQILDECFNKGNLSLCDQLIAPTWRNNDPASPQVPNGPSGMKALVQGYRDAYPDLRMTIEQQIGEGNLVATRWTAVGTHKGKLMGLNPTQRRATVTGITVDRIENGKIVESWANWDALGMYQQLGFIPKTETFGTQPTGQRQQPSAK